MLEKLETLERPEDVWAVAEKVRFRFAPAPRTGDNVLEATGLGAERGGRTLFAGLDLLVRRGDRIGIVGPNGTGKSTLLRLLAGVGERGDAGSIRRGTNLCEGYFDQHLGTLDPSRSAVEEIRSVRADMNVDATRQYLARFRFWGDDPLRKVSGFSGGERSRLALAKLLLEPRNLLFLDEPTNHLDIPAAEILEEALSGFDGTVVLVSHDRRFLEAVTTRLIHVREGGAEVLPGGFADYAERLAGRADRRTPSNGAREAIDEPPEPEPGDRERGERKRSVKRSASTSTAPPADETPEARRRAFEADKAAQRALERKRRRVKELEEEIARREAEVEKMREELKGDPGGDWAKLAEKAKEEQALTRRIEEAMSEWMTLSEELSR
jgi:ATP-binding cassette subfamily F protein 3